jgi:hypothetical protein
LAIADDVERGNLLCQLDRVMQGQESHQP